MNFLPILLFVICLLASGIGGAVGGGGGVIIKPVVDALGAFPVSTVSFCSSCTVLTMAVASLIRTSKNGIKLQVKTSTAIAVGAICGGFAGRGLLEFVRSYTGSESGLGLVQSILLITVIVLILIYVCFKEHLPSFRLESMAWSAVLGFVLGAVSAFIGIGGGPLNVAVLFLFFSMNAKEAGKNSLFIILFAQAGSVVSAVAKGTVPEFTWAVLLAMIAGGVGGGFLGAYIVEKTDNKRIEKLFVVMLLFIICVSIRNVFRFIN